MSFSALQYDAYRVGAPVLAAVLLILLAVSRGKAFRVNGGSGIFALYLLATVGFLIANTLEISSTTAAGNLFWSRFIYLFIPFIPMLWFSFTLRIAREGKPLEPHYAALLLVVPLMTVAMVFSDTLMPYVWSSIDYFNLGKYVLSVRRHGPWFLFFALYSYLLSFGGLIIAIRSFTFKREYFQKRSVLLLVGVAVPLAANAVFLFKPFPGLVKDLTPIGYAIGAFFFFFAVYRMDAFSIVPVAREQLVEQLSDGILTFDSEHRIADANKAALEMLKADESLIGKRLSAEGPEKALLPAEVAASALEGRRGVYSTRKRDGSTAYYSVEPIELPSKARHRGRLLVIRDETELRVALSRLEELARTDALTGLPNRRGFHEGAAAIVSSAIRYGEPVAAAIFDLDNFKQVNDSWGRTVGDDVLRSFAKILLRDLRGADQSGRIGGEEFALILPRTDLVGAKTVCERIRQDFERHEFRTDRGEYFSATVSVGLTVPSGAQYSVESLLAAADSALYNAKASGRNRVFVESRAMARKPAAEGA